MLEKVTVKAKFTNLTANDGKTTLKFTLDPESVAKSPELIAMNNKTVNLDIYGDQTVLFVDSDTGEYLDDDVPVEDVEAEPEEDEPNDNGPYELPPAAVEDAA